MKNHFVGPISGGAPLDPLFLFSSFFLLPFFVFSSFLFFHFFSFLFISSFIFPKKKFLLSYFSCISFKYFLLLALISEFNYFLRSRCSMRCGVWDWVGPPAWGESMLQLPRVGRRLLACLKRSIPRLYYCCVGVVVVVFVSAFNEMSMSTHSEG